MNLSTSYLGLTLPHPLMPGASPMVEDLGTVKRLEDAGAAAIVMHSLFEEQLVAEQMATVGHADKHSDAFPEALSFFPKPKEYRLGPDEYLDQIRRIKDAVNVPVIASLNGVSLGGWMEHARLIEEAGADGIELNVYSVGTDPSRCGGEVEERIVDMVVTLRRFVRIPVAVKLSPFYTSLTHFAAELDRAGASGLVLFNRFYQPDIDVEKLEVARSLRLSTSAELLLRLRWLALLSGRVRPSLAASGGVHTPLDVIKAVMTGAHAVQVVSALLQNGPSHLETLRKGVAEWLEKHEYESLEQAQGSMNLESCPDPAAFERANYAHILQTWRPD